MDEPNRDDIFATTLNPMNDVLFKFLFGKEEHKRIPFMVCVISRRESN